MEGQILTKDQYRELSRTLIKSIEKNYKYYR